MGNPGRSQTLEQQRAAAAWNAVQKVPAEKGKEFKSIAGSLPADIQSNGLGQTLAFLEAKGEDQHRRTLDALAGWVRKQLSIQDNSLIEWLMTKASVEQYRHATTEAIAFAIWMKRFAEGRFKDKGDDKGKG